ncbi:MFS transporter, partial [Streptomyces sp. NPDC046203]|uniref:MFS transporter n=1 Tax=Streptomyces sp. NPDC046203 TaxID=3154602 RepID=UPI00340B5A4B
MTPVRLSKAATLLAVIALLISTIGDEVALVALALRGADRTGLASVVSAQMLAGLVPGIALGGPIGRIVDRFRLDVVLGVTLALECAIAAAAAAFADGPVLLISTMLFLGALGAVAQTCVMALVPRLFPASDTQLKVNGIMESTRNGGYIVGPLLVGLLTAHGGTGLALAVDAGTFAFALLSIPVITQWLALRSSGPPAAADAPSSPAGRPAGEPAQESTQGSGEESGKVSAKPAAPTKSEAAEAGDTADAAASADPARTPDTTEDTAPAAPPAPAPAKGGLRFGLALLWTGAQRRAVLGTIVLTVASTSVVNVLMPFFAREIPGGTASYGTLLATWSVGLVVGPFVLRGRIGARPTAVLAVGASAIIGLCHLLTAAYLFLPAMLAASLCGGMANAVQNVTLRTHVMADCPQEVRGRVGAAYGATLQSSVAVGFALAGFAPAHWARWGILTGGAVAFVVGTLGWLRARALTPAEPPAVPT